jgi:phage host-nuclease inhibitor protein Gam
LQQVKLIYRKILIQLASRYPVQIARALLDGEAKDKRNEAQEEANPQIRKQLEQEANDLEKAAQMLCRWGKD